MGILQISVTKNPMTTMTKMKQMMYHTLLQQGHKDLCGDLNY